MRTPSVPALVYIANSAKIGGGNRVLMDLIGGVDRSRLRPVLVVPGAGPMLEWAQANDVPSYVMPAAEQHTPFALMRQVAVLSAVIVRERAAILHAFAPACYRAASIAGRLLGVRRVCHLHFPPGSAELSWAFRFGVDAVVTCYTELAADVRRVLGERQDVEIVAIPNGIDLTRFTPGESSTGSEHDWRRGASHVVVIVGHLSEVKGYPALLEAAATITAELPACRFVAVGTDTLGTGYGTTLRQRARDLGVDHAVQFIGWREDVRDILRAADVMVLPSLAEGLPLSVLEAMACGRAVVATAVNGTPEAVVHGTTGLLIRPKRSDELADAVLSVLKDPERSDRMGAAGRARVETLFSLERVNAQFQELYARLMQRRRRAAGQAPAVSSV